MDHELEELIRLEYETAMEEEIKQIELQRLAMTVPEFPE